jgi:hypothetical protein
MTHNPNSDELEAIASIYGEECTIHDQSKDQSITFTVRIPEITADLTFELSSQYPHTAPPQLTATCPKLNSEQRLALHSQCLDIWHGESCCFDMIEHFRTSAQELIQSSVEPTVVATETQSVVEMSESDHEETATDAPTSYSHTRQTQPSRQSSNHLPEPQFVIGQTITDRKSVFIPYYCPVQSENDVKAAVEALHSNPKLSRATHIMHAYVLQSSQAFDDDGETAAGSRMLHLLNVLKCTGVFVAVVRWFGGVQLGPARFKHINTATRQVLEQAGIVQPSKKSR